MIKDALKKLQSDIQSLHHQFCDIYTSSFIEDEETGESISNYTLSYKKIPCHLDWETGITLNVNDTETATEVSKKGKIYTDIVIPSLSIIHVYSIDKGKTYNDQWFKNSTQSSIYESHKVTNVEIYSKWGDYIEIT